MAELRYNAERFKETGIAVPIDADCKVVYSDTTLTSDVAETLSAAVAPLENVPDKDKDWHPGSNEQVLDLVHPSLFPLIYGRSRVLPQGKVGVEDCTTWTGKGEVIPVPYSKINTEGRYVEYTDCWSGRFQWLPSDIAFSGEDSVRITSYINNLHPSHKDLYNIIETVISKSIPLWNEVLESTVKLEQVPILKPTTIGGLPGETTLQPKPPRIDVNKHYWSLPEYDYPSSDDDGDFHEDPYWSDDRVLHYPEPDEYTRPQAVLPENIVDLRTEFAQKGLQVIVKLANIHLTPSSPTYAGGSWHVEGQLNEHIVATSLFYYSQSNIGTSNLAFRQVIKDDGMDLEYEQSQYAGIEECLGIENNEPAITNLGAVQTKTGRLLAFPNVIQHRVPPFGLEDPAKPGYRKIIALFLVDPYVRVLSTAKVPPQQKDWWSDEVLRMPGFEKFENLPMELKTEILDGVDEFPIGLEEAKAIREQVIVERSRIHDQFSEEMDEYSFCFCEH